MSDMNQNDDVAKRRRSRVPMNLSLIVKFDDFEINTQTINVSLKGLLCEPNESINENKVCYVNIWLTEHEKIEVKGEVVRSSSDGMAIDFKKMNVDSFSHLYNLIRFNCEDPDQLDMEFKYPAYVDRDEN